jgi:lipopolysaccharide assembly outer membrane protein LptD (OstA)
VIGDLCNVSAQNLRDQARENSSTHHFDITVGYRYLSSSRHFVGTVEQVQREILHNQVENNIHLMDVAISYQLNHRWSLTGSLPIMVATRNEPKRGLFHVAGIGDASIGARAWIFRNPTESGGNVSFGLSLKMPTGKDNFQDFAFIGGKRVVITSDESVQAGDGSWGLALETSGYQRTYFNSMLYFSGTYLFNSLFNSKGTNGIPTFRTRPGEDVIAITDEYLYRGGISHALPKIKGLIGTIGGRMEGVPVRNAFGQSLGFRRPGYAISLDPGFIYARGRNTFSCNVPWAVERNRRASVSDIANHTHGDAAFADYLLMLSYTRHF